jgi:hypothetical protein
MRIMFDAAELAVMKGEYEDTPLTVSAIGLRHGCSGPTVSKTARREGWRLRRPGKVAAQEPTIAPAGVAAAGIAARMWNVITMKLDQMEKDMNSGALCSADLERDAKMIGTMIAGVQKVVPVPGEDKVSKPDGARSGPVAKTDEVERLQREIIERFERIQRRREIERGSE